MNDEMNVMFKRSDFIAKPIEREKVIKILEDMKQEDYELSIYLNGRSHMSEEQWDWLIHNFKEKLDKIE